MASRTSRIKQTLQPCWMHLPYDARQIIKRILLYDYLYGVPRYTRITFNREIPFIPPCAKPIQPPLHANYHKIQAFPFPNTGSNGEQLFLFYDIFAKDKQLFIFFVKADHQTLAISNEDIHITVNQQALTLKETIVGQNNARTLVYAFDYPFTEHQVCVSCKGISKDFTVSHIRPKQIGLLLHSTLFKDDHFLLPMFYDYYTKQGFDSFVWYYNGIWDQTLQNKYSFGDNVIILSWPYPFFRHAAGYSAHHTQKAHALYKYGKSGYEYISFLDLDEYVKTECANLRSYILQNPGYLSYAFLNCWAWVFRFLGRYPRTWQRLPKVLLRAKNTVQSSWPFITKNADNQIVKYQIIQRSNAIHKTSAKATISHGYPTTSPDGTAQHKIMLVKSSSILLHVNNFRKRTSGEDLTAFADLYKWER